MRRTTKCGAPREGAFRRTTGGCPKGPRKETARRQITGRQPPPKETAEAGAGRRAPRRAAPKGRPPPEGTTARATERRAHQTDLQAGGAPDREPAGQVRLEIEL